MGRPLLAGGGGGGAFTDDLPDVLTDVGERDTLPEGAGSGLTAANLRSELLATAQEQLEEQREHAVNAFHSHLPRTRRGGGGAKGLIALLVLVHVAFIAYWALIWWRQRRQRASDEARRGQRSAVPQKVSSEYDWAPVIPKKLNALPKIPNIQLISLSTKGH